jgi:hypothetical protein
MRDFELANDRFGSFAPDRHGDRGRGMSASPRLCCKAILRIRARKIDSRLGASAQC